ncbi:unnamed protein product [Paramecium sonneborni]|uniref:Uncharacterized protein n=1 Tax=Paramecium sonneborni TaxID=65129 RepID=A0A8S1RQ43_9CILI|nr:unnamed protein product [Paramecium sonneborni]
MMIMLNQFILEKSISILEGMVIGFLDVIHIGRQKETVELSDAFKNYLENKKMLDKGHLERSLRRNQSKGRSDSSESSKRYYLIKIKSLFNLLIYFSHLYSSLRIRIQRIKQQYIKELNNNNILLIFEYKIRSTSKKKKNKRVDNKQVWPCLQVKGIPLLVMTKKQLPVQELLRNFEVQVDKDVLAFNENQEFKKYDLIGIYVFQQNRNYLLLHSSSSQLQEALRPPVHLQLTINDSIVNANAKIIDKPIDIQRPLIKEILAYQLSNQNDEDNDNKKRKNKRKVEKPYKK